MQDLIALLSLDESEILDFKEKWHSDNDELLHDILCLSNSQSNELNRYLVFGVSDDKNIVGLIGDGKRKNTQNINDLIKNSNINIPINTKVIAQKVDGNEIDFLQITVNLRNRPYYLRKSRNKLQAGAIYSRLGDNSVPMNETTNENEIINLWKERFGLELSPMERMINYIQDYDNWVHAFEDGDGGGRELFYYREFPEFTVKQGRKNTDNYDEAWSRCFSNDGWNTCYAYELKYFDTLLHKEYVVHIDGSRYRIAAPERLFLYRDDIGNIYADGDVCPDGSENYMEMFYKTTNSIKYHLDFIFHVDGRNAFYKKGMLTRKIHIFDEGDNISEKLKTIYIDNFEKDKERPYYYE